MLFGEMTQRYQEFCQFRVIGSSHDERMIPMIEVGKGKDVHILCLWNRWNPETDARASSQKWRQSTAVPMNATGIWENFMK